VFCVVPASLRPQSVLCSSVDCTRKVYRTRWVQGCVVVSMIIIIGFSVSLCVNCVEKKIEWNSTESISQSIHEGDNLSQKQASKQAMKDGHLQAR